MKKIIGIAQRGGRRLFPLSVRTLLVALVLIPLTVSIALASTIVVHQSAVHNLAEAEHKTTLVLDSLLRARAAVTTEYLDSVEVVVGRSFHLSVMQVGLLLGVNLQADLADARRADNRLHFFAPRGLLSGRVGQLTRLHQDVDRGTTSVAQMEAFFGGLQSTIDARWLSTFDRLSADSGSTASLATKNRLTALDRSFTASTAGLTEVPLVQALLTTRSDQSPWSIHWGTT